MSYLRLILIGLFSIVSFSINAKHLEFMGIPITGTITAFQSKLQSKGCTIAKGNNLLPYGIRGFKGVFAGKDCDIYVWYNHRTKQVYQVRAITDCGTLSDVAHNTFYYYKNLLNQKYEGMALNSDMLEDSTKTEYEFDMVVIQPPIEVGAQALGTIEVHIIEYDSYPTTYGVAITYEDFEGASQNEQNTLNDL